MFGRKIDVRRIEELERDVRNLREAHEELVLKYTKLRGAVYGARLHKAEEPAPARETKAELLRRAGFTPGRPVIHKE